MNSVLSNSPSLCVQGQTNSPSLSHRPALLLLLNTLVETGGKACGCRGPHRCMYNQVLHHSSQLTRQSLASQLLFQTYGWKKKQTLSVRFRQRKSGSNKKTEGWGEERRWGRRNSSLTMCGNIGSNAVLLTWSLAIVSSSSCQVLQVHATVENSFRCDIFISYFFPLGAIYRVRRCGWK